MIRETFKAADLSSPAPFGSRAVWAEIDLGAICHNLSIVRRSIGAGRMVMPVVKADAYGHGMIPVARTALAWGAEWLGVATSDEGLCLRETRGFESIPIMVLGPTLGREAEALQRAGLAISIGTAALLRDHLAMARRLGKAARLHIQTDTGIGRDGFRFDDMSYLEDAAGQKESIEGVWMHFAVADETTAEHHDFTVLQCERFETNLHRVRKAGYTVIAHAANSGAILRHPRAHHDLVRPGIMIYGLEPNDNPALCPELRTALSLKGCIASIKEVEPGDTISYGRLYRADSRKRIGIIPVGYGDGYPRILSSKSHVLVRGKRAPILGRICMDQFMIDLDAIPEAGMGDEVVLYGSQGSERLYIEDAARLAGTISYELTCQLTRRIPRVYKPAI